MAQSRLAGGHDDLMPALACWCAGYHCERCARLRPSWPSQQVHTCTGTFRQREAWCSSGSRGRATRKTGLGVCGRVLSSQTLSCAHRPRALGRHAAVYRSPPSPPGRRRSGPVSVPD